PAQNLREAATTLAPHLKPATPVVACAKGIERGTHRFMTEVIAETIPDAIPAILSGPNFADDVARGLPTAVTLAARDEGLASDLVQALGSSTFRPYHTTDVRGVEIGGAAKNVLAIAAGIVVGRQLGASALAALTTRGFSELARLGRACGARSETLAGLSGLGDLILSCSSLQSRNFAFGIALGRGEQPNRDKLAEGEFTAPVLIELAASQNVDMPVSKAVAAILGAKGAKGEAWTGVRNFTARQNLVNMKKGDKAFFYHSNEGKEIVGIAEIIKEAYPDPSDKTGKFVCVDIKADKPLKTPVTMAAIKADKKLADMALVKYSRLSVQPVTAEEWKMDCKMGGL
ncbi:MAG: EVE domain-containing protein, partial [Alphaproteobacteria bacterium]